MSVLLGFRELHESNLIILLYYSNDKDLKMYTSQVIDRVVNSGQWGNVR
jgi:hypothetical protein